MTIRRAPITLQWAGKDAPATPAKVLMQEVPLLSVRAHDAVDHFDNLLVQGDNLAALGLWADTLRGRVRCAYLDPPYNTGQTLHHYDDDVEHAAWLSMMRDRLELLRPLLADDGVVVAQVDRHESAYLKVLLDEVFGRRAYVTTVAVRMSATSGFKIEHTDRTLVKNVEYLHVYARRLTLCAKAFEETLTYDDHYAYLLSPDRRSFRRLVDDDIVGRLLADAGLSRTNANLPALYERSAAFRSFVVTHATRVCRSHTAPAPARRALAAGTLFGADVDGVVMDDVVEDAVEERTWSGTSYLIRRTRSGVDQLIPLSLKLNPVDRTGGPDRLALTNILGDWWDGFHLDMGNVDGEGDVGFKSSKKPERLLRRILHLFTQPGDLVLDVFGGSGTTAAVAHKMRRQWITVEQGAHCQTLIQPRLARVVRGDDPTGVTSAVGWQGGGGFRFYALVPATERKPSTAPHRRESHRQTVVNEEPSKPGSGRVAFTERKKHAPSKAAGERPAQRPAQQTVRKKGLEKIDGAP